MSPGPVLALEAAPVPGPAPAGEAARPAAGSLADTLIPAGAALVLVAASPQTADPFWAPKVVVVLAFGLAGLVALGRLLAGRDRPALALGGFVAWAGLSAALAAQPALAVFGLYGLGTGWLFVAAVAGWWALGRHLGPLGRRRLEAVVMAGAVGEAAVAAASALSHSSSPLLAPYQGRYEALFDNPIYLAGFLAAALALAARRLAGGQGGWGSWATVAACGAGLELSGERLGLVVAGAAVAVVGLGWRFGRTRARALGLAGRLAAVAALGVGLGWLAGYQGVVATGRVVASNLDNSLEGRLASWGSAARAVAERPLVGWGPGRYEAAEVPRRTLAEARQEGPDRYFADAHDLVAEYAATTGLVGLGLLGAWLWGARRGRGPLAWFAAALGAHLLLEPLSVGIVPLAALALGACAPGTWGPGLGRRGGVAALALAGAGLALGGLLLAGDASFVAAYRDYDAAEVLAAGRLLPPWPDVTDQAAQIAAFGALQGRPGQGARAIGLAARAAGQDPADPEAWILLGDYQARFGSRPAARAAFSRALQANPWSEKALLGLYATTPPAQAARRAAIRDRLALLGVHRLPGHLLGSGR
jgi:hypothetical protein